MQETKNYLVFLDCSWRVSEKKMTYLDQVLGGKMVAILGLFSSAPNYVLRIINGSLVAKNKKKVKSIRHTGEKIYLFM